MTWGPRIAGLLVGLAIAAGYVLSAYPAAGPPLGLDLRITASNSGSVMVEPAGTVLSARALRPGGVASGRVVLHNQTSVKQGFVPRLSGSEDLDRGLRVELADGGRTLYRGTLGGLRGGKSRPFVVGVGRPGTLTVRLSVPDAAAHAALRGRSADFEMTFEPRDAR